MKSCFYVGLGGAVGSVLRYLISLIPINSVSTFPYKTLLINVIGSFAIGLVAAVTGKRTDISPEIILLMKTGICGGFTTFSTFALESSALLQSGEVFSAIIYITASLSLSIAAVFLAQILVR